MFLGNPVNGPQGTLFLLYGRHNAVSVPVSGTHAGALRPGPRMVGKDHRLRRKGRIPHMLLVAVYSRLEAGSSVEALIQRLGKIMGIGIGPGAVNALIMPPDKVILSGRFHAGQAVVPGLFQPYPGISRCIGTVCFLFHQFQEAFREPVAAGSQKRKPSFSVRAGSGSVNETYHGLGALTEGIDHIPVHPSHRSNHRSFKDMAAHLGKEQICCCPGPLCNVLAGKINDVKQRSQRYAHINGA